MTSAVSSSPAYSRSLATKPRSKRAPRFTNSGMDYGKENFIDCRPMRALPVYKTRTLQECSNISSHYELDTARWALQKAICAKDAAETMLLQKEGELRAMVTKTKWLEDVLKTRESEGEKSLEEKLRKLQVLKAFQPPLVGQQYVIADVAPDDPPMKKNRRSKKVKKPCTAFLAWCNDQRQAVCDENPEATSAELCAVLIEKWRTVSDEARKAYQDQCQAARDKYLNLITQEKREADVLKTAEEDQRKKALELVKNYRASKKGPEGDGKMKTEVLTEARKETSTMNENNLSRPKRSTTAFSAYVDSRRPALLEANVEDSQVSRILGNEWRKMSKIERAQFEKMRADKKAPHAAEHEAYRKSIHDPNGLPKMKAILEVTAEKELNGLTKLVTSPANLELTSTQAMNQREFVNQGACQQVFASEMVTQQKTNVPESSQGSMEVFNKVTPDDTEIHENPKPEESPASVEIFKQVINAEIGTGETTTLEIAETSTSLPSATDDKEELPEKTTMDTAQVADAAKEKTGTTILEKEVDTAVEQDTEERTALEKAEVSAAEKEIDEEHTQEMVQASVELFDQLTTGAEKQIAANLQIFNEEAKIMKEEQEDMKKLATRVIKDLHKPKRAPSAYLLFSIEQWKTLPQDDAEMSRHDKHAAVFNTWKEMSDEEKLTWREKAAMVKEKEKADMDEHRSSTEPPTPSTLERLPHLESPRHSPSPHVQTC